MSSGIPRLRMFAGPNGSGKSTFKSMIRKELLGVYINPDDIEKAQSKGYRTYLYYVATENPEINVSRVRQRVSLGGHPVPEEKIASRYKRSLELLYQAVKATNRAYIFDNSTHEHIWLAEITDGRTLEMRSEQMPVWFKQALWVKFNADKN